MNVEYSKQAEDCKETFLLKPKTWDDIPEDEPLPDEVAAFEECFANKEKR